jgi:hypothetical protein
MSTSLLTCRDGVSAVEFAFITPLATVGLLFLGLTGFEVYHRIQLNQVVRAGIEYARMAPAQEPGRGADDLASRVKAMLVEKGYTIATGPVWEFNNTVVVTVGDDCWCPETPNIVNVCRTICAGGRPGVRRYHILTAYFPTWPRALRAGLLKLGILSNQFGGSIVSEMEVNVR